MKLYEFEGHKILAKAGIASPFFVTCANSEEVKEAKKRLKFPIVAKVQVLSGKRGKGGGVKIFKSEKKLVEFCNEMLGNDFEDEKVMRAKLMKKIIGGGPAQLLLNLTARLAAKRVTLRYLHPAVGQA